MTKDLRKAIMTRSRFKNTYNKKRTPENFEKYRKQRNFVVKLLRKIKSDYFDNLNIKSLEDNKTFWKTIQPYFNNKTQSSNKIFLSENGTILNNSQDVANTFNDYFVNITKTLDLDISQTNCENFTVNVSILKIQELYENDSEKFNIVPITMKEVELEIMALNPKKSTISNDIPTKILKQFCNTYLAVLTNIISSSLAKGTFPKKI